MTDLLDLARTIATEAADLAVRRRREGVAVAATKSTIVDVVTEADREVEELVRGRIADARPQDGILGEEGGGQAGSSGLTWIVDPIDGTVNYLYGIPHYAVSIAVVEGEPDPQLWTALAGVVVNPPSGELFAAAAGGGATLGGRPIRVADPVPLELALVGTGFSYDAEARRRQGAVAAGLLPAVRDLRRMGAAALDLCAVACGRLDAYFELGLAPWDHAAGALIAREAGAVALGARGARQDRELVLAAHPDLAAALAPLL